MEPTPTSERSRSNGRGDAPDEPHRNGGAPDRDAGTGGVTGLARRIARFAASRIPVADLDERDPDYIRATLPGLWLISSLYFRAEVRGLEHVPEDGGALLVETTRGAT